MERYLAQIQALGYKFIGFLAEAFGLPLDALSCFYDSDDRMQHRSKVGILHSIILFIFHFVSTKIVMYPPLGNAASDQGVGPHYDAGFLTFVCHDINRSFPNTTFGFFFTASASFVSSWSTSTKYLRAMDWCPPYSKGRSLWILGKVDQTSWLISAHLTIIPM